MPKSETLQVKPSKYGALTNTLELVELELFIVMLKADETKISKVLQRL